MSVKFPIPYWFRVEWMMALVFLIALFAHADLAPLEETHWDAPIYVQLSQRAAETHMLESYHDHAKEIKLGPAGAHWNFTRIGHIFLLGEITKLFGSSEAALVTMQWIYRFFMALSVILCVGIGLRLVHLFRLEKPDLILLVGYAIAAVTYVISDSYRGLQGHLVSEPPAFAVLALFALALLWAVERRSLISGALAGGLLFLLFFIRVDAVFPGVIFLAVLTVALAISRKVDAIPYIAVSALIAFMSYMTYAWWFSPLVNPKTLAAFSDAVKTMYPGLPLRSLIQIVIAGGFLWVGAVASLARWRDPVVRFAIVWFAFALLPLVLRSLQGGEVQVRMAFFVAIPLIILAGEGWSWILGRLLYVKDVRPIAAALGLLLFLAFTPYAKVMLTLREAAINYLPLESQKYVFLSAMEHESMQPLTASQDFRLGLLVRPKEERLTFKYLQARELGAFLYRTGQPTYLIWPSMFLVGQQSTLQEFMGLIRYFGKAYPENANLLLTRLPNKINTEPCTAKVPTALEPVVFCTTLTSLEREHLRQNKIALFILSADGYPMPEIPPAHLKMRLLATPYTLYEVGE